MQESTATVLENTPLNQDVFRMTLRTSLTPLVKPGQFVNVQVPGMFLRRPISVCKTNGFDQITLVYKVVGEGTDILSKVKEDDEISLFGPLGTGFPIEKRNVMLIGGGVGVPPLVETAKRYRAQLNEVTVVLGFNDESQMILVNEFEQLGCKVYIATMDGSYGVQGTVMDAIRENAIEESFVLACGPLGMLKAINNAYSDGYISLEARMACGLGACMGCVVKDTNDAALRVCKDGPVFPIGKVVL